MTAGSPQLSRPRLALRLGVTGARSLRDDQVPRLRAQLRAVLALAREEMERLAGERTVAAAYAPAGGHSLVPALRLLSPLARGADRLAAEEALAQGYELYVPMPFPRADYETDFKGNEKPEEPPLSADEDLAQFRALLAQAGDAWFALDGDRGPAKNAAYEAVGRFVVRHCDLLIAIWDGGPSGRRGDSGDIARYAANAGVPVWWIYDSEHRAPVWIADIQDLRDPPKKQPDPEAALRTHLKEIIAPPSSPGERQGWFEVRMRMGKDRRIPPEATYFNEVPKPNRRVWRAYSTLMRWASGLDPPWTQPRSPNDDVGAYWFARYKPADDRAREYAERYRSSYIWVFALATAALFFGALGLGLHVGGVAEGWTIAAAGTEGLTLLLILLLVAFSLRHDWHERSIAYRLLAELCRKEQTLA